MVNCYCIRRPAVFFSSLFCPSFGGGFVASREMEMGSLSMHVGGEFFVAGLICWIRVGRF